MRLPGIEHPRGLRLRLAYHWSRRHFGKVLAPIQLLYARQPPLLRLGMLAMGIEERHLRIPADLALLIRAYASQMNGCAFCQDLTLARALQQQLGQERFEALTDRRAATIFTPAEQAALDLVEEYHRDRRVSDRTFEALREQFSDEQIVDLVWVNAIDEYWNALTIPLGIGSDGLAAAMKASAAG